MASPLDEDPQIVCQHLLKAALILDQMKYDSTNDDTFDWLESQVRYLRDVATIISPPFEDFGGSNVVGLWAYRQEDVG